MGDIEPVYGRVTPEFRQGQIVSLDDEQAEIAKPAPKRFHEAFIILNTANIIIGLAAYHAPTNSIRPAQTRAS